MTPPASAPSGSSLPDLLGLNGAPDATLHAVLTRFQVSELRGGRLILLTDRQGERRSPTAHREAETAKAHRG